jgi:hypothetical protein
MRIFQRLRSHLKSEADRTAATIDHGAELASLLHDAMQEDDPVPPCCGCCSGHDNDLLPAPSS